MAETQQNIHPLTVITNQLDARTPFYAASLPSHYPVERFKRDIVGAIASNPDLVTVDRASLFNSVSRLALIGLRADGKEAALVVFKDRERGAIAVAMPMVAGMLKLFRQSGHFKQVAVEAVREGDEFRYFTDDTGQHIYHEPGDTTDAPIVKVFALALTKDGGRFIEVMSRADIEKRRNVSRAKDGPMWRDWWQEAAQKTVLRSLLKVCPSSSDDLDRLSKFDDEDDGDFASLPPPEPKAPRERLSVASALDRFGGGDTPGEVVDVPSDNDDAARRESYPTEGTVDKARAVEIARELGAHHRGKGVQRRAVPPEYREAGREAEADAWREGWESAG